MVLRHEAGSRLLKVYWFNGSQLQIGYTELSKMADTVTDKTLILGAAKSDAGVFSNYATGVLHSCRLWYGDLGDTVCRKIANWPRETYRWEVGNFGSYKLAADPNVATQLDFVCASLLSRTMYMTTSGSTAGGFPAMRMYAWFVARVIPALPAIWQRMMEECTVKYMEYVDGTNYAIGSAGMKMWIPSWYEMTGTSTEPWLYEGAKHIPFFTSHATRAKWNGPDNLPRAGHATFSRGTDPSLDSSLDVQEGDLWVNTSALSAVSLRKNGAWKGALYYFLRGATISSPAKYCLVYNSGAPSFGGDNASYSYSACPRFSI